MTNASAYDPEIIRVSVGSAIVLGLVEGRLDALPTTVYLLTYQDRKCTANCAFCSQAKSSKSRADMLSRVNWPPFATTRVVDRIEKAAKHGKIKRVCIQALNYTTVFDDVLSVISSIRSRCTVPISISCQPVNSDMMKKLAEAGVERIGIPLDAATEEIFDKIKGKQVGGPYVWQGQLKVLEGAVKIFGRNMVSTHVIVGLGETEKDIAKILQLCVDMGVYPALFAFTPVSGTALERSLPPSLRAYRRVQLARYLITLGQVRYENLRFDNNERVVDFGVSRKTLNEIISSGTPFLTSGCPNCNRPYYNEKPGDLMFNFPRGPTVEEIKQIEKAFGE